MDVRKITVVSTRDQKRTIVETDATTLGELKSALTTAGVDFSDMTFYEALTRTELLDNDSVLPHDVPYKGEVTNELVFMLTNPNKKIKSGAFSEARVALYNEIISGNHADAVAEKYGKNFTNCSNAELAAFLDEMAVPTLEPCHDEVARRAIVKLVDILYEESYISSRQANEVNTILNAHEDTTVIAPYSNDEIDELLNGMSEFVR